MKSKVLSIRNLNAYVGDKQILHNISCFFEKKKITVLMGPNGSGKSTLARVVMGDSMYSYQLSAISSQTSAIGRIFFRGKNIIHMPTEERAKKGLFLSFQAPIAIPGVSVVEILGTQKMARSVLDVRIRRAAKLLEIHDQLLTRSIHDGFSGGERKKIELLQALVLQPTIAIFDEIDTGVDVDALKCIAQGIRVLQKRGTGILLITHNERILQYVPVNRVLVMVDGKMMQEGDTRLIQKIQNEGFHSFKA